MKDYIILSVQPDEVYFHWQLQVQLVNFKKYNVEERYHVVIAYDHKPSVEILEIERKSSATFHYIRLKENKKYPPSIVPFALEKLFKKKKFGVPILHIDSDVILLKNLELASLLGSSVSYLSNAPYITNERFIELSCSSLLKKALSIVGLTEREVKSLDRRAGGAQWLLKRCEEPLFWKKVGKDSLEIYDLLVKGKQLYPELRPWLASMYSLLWNLKLHKKRMRVHRHLDFHLSSDLFKKTKRTFLHNSGLLFKIGEGHFNKLNYKNVHPFKNLEKNRHCSNPRVYADVYCNMVLQSKEEWLQK